MGIILSKFRRGSGGEKSNEASGSHERRGRARTRTPPPFKDTDQINCPTDAPLVNNNHPQSNQMEHTAIHPEHSLSSSMHPEQTASAMPSSLNSTNNLTDTNFKSSQKVEPSTRKKSNVPSTMSSTLRPHEFVWKYGGQKVCLTGDFDNWSQSILMTRDQSGIFRATVDLDEKKAWHFKFVVDGVWKCSLDWPCETDATGNANNIICPEK